MRWEDALAAANRIGVHSKLAAYEPRYRLLDGGPARLGEREQDLRRSVSAVQEGEALPDDLGCDLFVWMNVDYIACRRRPEDLPSSSRDDVESRNIG